jgi:alkaline phosphatase
VLNTTKGVTSPAMRDLFRYTIVRGSALALFLALTAGLFACGTTTPTTVHAFQQERVTAKNVIVMISDGCGYSHVQAVDYYLGAKSVFEGFPVRLGVSTYPYEVPRDVLGYDPALMWQSFDYGMDAVVTDSAAAATALASGVKTLKGAVGVDPSGAPVHTVTERAEALGKATGVVTTVPWSHATPAAFVAHTADRNDYAEIARQMIMDSAVDVVMGAGNPDFDNDGHPSVNDAFYVGGRSLWADLKDSDPESPSVADADGDGRPDPWTLIQTKAEFESLATATETPARVCGTAQVFSTLQQTRSGNLLAAPYAVPLNSTVPDLSTMVAGALNVLEEDPDGLFLMVEAGGVDWASHLGETGRMIEEQAAFVDAVQLVTAWVLAHGGWQDTLLIVTADHETGMLWGPGAGTVDGRPIFAPVADRGPGATPGVTWHSAGHTNQLVPLYAIGVNSGLLQERARLADPVRGNYIDNAAIGDLILGSL